MSGPPIGSPLEWPQTWLWAGRLGWTRPAYPDSPALSHTFCDLDLMACYDLMAACYHAVWVVLDSDGVWTWAPWFVGSPVSGLALGGRLVPLARDQVTTAGVDRLLIDAGADMPRKWTIIRDAMVLRCARGDVLAAVRGDRARRPRRYIGETMCGRRWGVPDVKWDGRTGSSSQVQAAAALRRVRERIFESGRWRREVLGLRS